MSCKLIMRIRNIFLVVFESGDNRKTYIQIFNNHYHFLTCKYQLNNYIFTRINIQSTEHNNSSLKGDKNE